MSIKESKSLNSSTAWFSGDLFYEGQGRAEFDDSSGSIEGAAQAFYDGFQRLVIEIAADKVQSVTNSLDVRMCPSITISTSHGKIIAAANELLDSRVEELSNGRYRKWLRYYPQMSCFDAAVHNSPAYWVLPLQNFVSSFKDEPVGLERHVLRLNRAADSNEALAQAEVETALPQVWLHNLIRFTYNESLCFIEPLPTYDVIVQQLQAGLVRCVTTSVAIGEIGPESIEIDDVDRWFPIDILLLLSVATGVQVGTPWIEFRDTQGTLIRRLHARQLMLPVFPRSYKGIIDEGVHHGIGRLLTQALASPALDTPMTRTALHHLIQSRIDGLFSEERLSILVRCLDALCEQEDVNRQQLLASLEQTLQDTVYQLLSGTSEQIRNLARQVSASGNKQASSTLVRVADRAKSAAEKDSTFGQSLVGLLEKFGFPDADILNTHYQQGQDNKTWAATISRYRNTVIHSGYFDFSSHHDEAEVRVLVKHLYDILVRIVLKYLNYDGTYQPTVLDMETKATVDWVQPDMDANELGYPAFT